MPNASQIAQVRGNIFLAGLLSVVRTEVPVIDHFDVHEMAGTRFWSLAITALPNAGFLNVNEGYTATECTLQMAEFNAFRIGGSVEVPESSAKVWNDENGRGAKLPYTFESLQAETKMKAFLRTVQQQIFTGTSNDTKGFPGLKELTPFVSGNTYALTDTPQDSAWAKSVVNAGGVTANVASSVYAVSYGPTKCCLRMGGPQGMSGFLAMTAWERQYLSATDPVDGLTKRQWHNVSTGEGYVGLSVSGSNEPNADRKFRQDSVRRLCNLTPLVPLTEAKLEALVNSFPPGYAPTAIFMSYRSAQQLRDSLSSGSGSSSSPVIYLTAPQDGTAAQRSSLPTQYRGIPIIITDAVGNTDAIEA